MCEVCAIFGAGEHWSDFGRLRNERFPFEDIQIYRRDRKERLALIGRLLAPQGLTVEDWDGEAAMVFDRQGRSKLAPTLGDIWTAADSFAEAPIDPLSETFVEGLARV